VASNVALPRARLDGSRGPARSARAVGRSLRYVRAREGRKRAPTYRLGRGARWRLLFRADVRIALWPVSSPNSNT